MAGNAAQPPIAPVRATIATDLASIRINLFEAGVITGALLFFGDTADRITVARGALIEREGVRKSQTVRRELDLN
jgi:hypothetical protein